MEGAGARGKRVGETENTEVRHIPTTYIHDLCSSYASDPALGILGKRGGRGEMAWN